MYLNVIDFSVGLSLPYHFGFGVNVADCCDWKFDRMYGPPEYAVGGASHSLNAASSCASVSMPPACAFAYHAGNIPLNKPCQSENGVLNTTVTVSPLSVPVTLWIWLYPFVPATAMFGSWPL